MSYLHDTIKYRGFDIKVYQDEDAQNPRQWFDNAGHLVFNEHNYGLGDGDEDSVDLDEWLRTQAYELAPEELQEKIDKFDPERGELADQGVWTYDALEKAHDQLMDEARDALKDNLLWAPCCVFTNSTQPAVHMGDWGDPPVGRESDAFHYITLKEAITEWGDKTTSPTSFDDLVNYGDDEKITLREAAQRCLTTEFSTYEEWCLGDVYGYVVEDADEEDVDSCWGFYGDEHEKSGLLESAKSNIDYHINKERKEHFRKVKTWCKHHIPMQLRYPMPQHLAL